MMYLQFDVCIVGSGPAGITLAREISRSGLRVCLLESGGHKPAEDPQNLNTGAVDSADGYASKPCGRDAVGSLAAPPISGITRCAVNPPGTFATCRWMKSTSSAATGCRKAAGLSAAERSSLSTSAPSRFAALGNSTFELSLGDGTKKSEPWQTEKIESIVSQFGSSEIFLKHYRRELVRDERVNVILQAVLLQLQMDPLSRAITSAQAGTPHGRKFQVRAQAFVLAAGGLENARILLLQDALQPGGLGNQHDMVGRCFMDHPSITLGTLIPSSSAVFGQAGFYDQHDVGGQAIMFKLHIRPEVMRREKMLNLCAVLVPHFKDLRSNSLAVLHQLLFRGPRFLWRHRSAEHRGPPRSAVNRPGRSVSGCSKITIRRVVAAGRD